MAGSQSSLTTRTDGLPVDPESAVTVGAEPCERFAADVEAPSEERPCMARPLELLGQPLEVWQPIFDWYDVRGTALRTGFLHRTPLSWAQYSGFSTTGSQPRIFNMETAPEALMASLWLAQASPLHETA
jgi:hypothetical protein